MLDILRGTSTRLVHLSIDLVYSGTRGGGHVEDDETDPVTVYGKTMAEAEQILLDQVVGTRAPTKWVDVPYAGDGRRSLPTTLSAAILRISLPMGVSFNGHAGAIDWIQSRFKKGNPATLYFDEIRTPTYTDCLNPLLSTVLARHDIQGLFHAGGPRRLSLYQIAQIVNRVGGYDPALLHGCMRIEAGPLPPRAGDVSLDSSKLARALGYQPFDPWPLDDEHVPTHRQWHFESPRGSPELLKRILYHNPRRRAKTSHPLAHA
jgi:dTDP-4-dehydrorhamnose reductase